MRGGPALAPEERGWSEPETGGRDSGQVRGGGEWRTNEMPGSKAINQSEGTTDWEAWGWGLG